MACITPLTSNGYGAAEYRDRSASAEDIVTQTEKPKCKPRSEFHLDIHYTGKKLTIPSYSYSRQENIKLGYGKKTTIAPRYTPHANGHDYQYSRQEHAEVFSGNGLTSSDIERERKERNVLLSEELPRFSSALLNKCDEVQDLRSGKRDRDIAVSKLRSNNLQSEELEHDRRTRNESLQENLNHSLTEGNTFIDLREERRIENESLSEIVSKDDKLVSLEREMREQRQKANETLSENVSHRPNNLSDVINSRIVNNASLLKGQTFNIEFIDRRFQSGVNLFRRRRRASLAALEEMYIPDIDGNRQNRTLMNEKLYGIRDQHLSEITNMAEKSKRQAARRNSVSVAQLCLEMDRAKDMMNVKTEDNLKLSQELANDQSKLQVLKFAAQQRHERIALLLDSIPESNVSDASGIRRAQCEGVLAMLVQQANLVETLVKDRGDKRREGNVVLSETLLNVEQLYPLSSMERNSLMFERLAANRDALENDRSRSERLIEEKKRHNEILSKQTPIQDTEFEKALMRRHADLESVQEHLCDNDDILKLAREKTLEERNKSNISLKDQMSDSDFTKAQEARKRNTAELMSTEKLQERDFSEIDEQRLRRGIAAVDIMMSDSGEGYNETHARRMIDIYSKQKQALAEQMATSMTGS